MKFNLTTRLRRFAVLVSVVALLAGCGGTSADNANAERPTEPTGTLTVRLYSGLGTSDPFATQSIPEWQVLRGIYESLVTVDDDFKPIPMLAESWDVSEDGMSYTFNLRDGVKFHDGSEMTSEDVVYSFQYFLENGLLGPNFKPVVKAVSAIDERTVRVDMVRPYGGLIGDMANQILSPAIVPSGSADNDGLATTPIGTGPFKVSEYENGTRAVFVPFEDYSPVDQDTTGLGGRKEVLVEQLEFVLIADDAAAVAALETGEVDLSIRLPGQEIERLNADENIEVLTLDGPNFVDIQLQLNKAPMDNLVLRQAIQHAVNKEEMLEVSGFGYGRLASSYIVPDAPWYSEESGTYDPYPYDPERAKQLVKESGYAGQEITILNSALAYSRSNAVLLQQMLKEVGITTVIDERETTEFLSSLAEGDFMFASQQGSARPTADAWYLQWYCGSGPRARFAYCNPEYDVIYDRATRSIDEEERLGLWSQLETILKDDAVLLPIYHADVVVGVRSNVKDFKGSTWEWANFHNVWVTE